MGLLVLLGFFAVCVVIGVPVAFALGIAALATFAFEGLPLMIGFQRIVSGINVFSLMAIPFFIFAGELMFHGGIAIRLVRFASAAVGAMRGGLGIVNVFSSMLFGGISGSAVADISALGLDPDPGDEGEGLRRRLRRERHSHVVDRGNHDSAQPQYDPVRGCEPVAGFPFPSCFSSGRRAWHRDVHMSGRWPPMSSPCGAVTGRRPFPGWAPPCCVQLRWRHCPGCSPR